MHPTMVRAWAFVSVDFVLIQRVSAVGLTLSSPTLHILHISSKYLPCICISQLDNYARAQHDASMAGTSSRMQQIRIERGLTQAQLAKRLKWHQSQVSRAERGITPIGEHEIAEIARALKTTASRLSGRTRS